MLNRREETLILIKPDAVKKNVWFEIMESYAKRFKMVKYRILTMDIDMAKKFYAVHAKKAFFNGLIEHMTSGPLIAMVVIGSDVIGRVRRLNGATNPAEAEEGTIRHLYGEPNGGPANAVHSSDSPENAFGEIKIFFGV